MNDRELADLFESDKLWIGGTTDPMPGVTQQIITTLRRSQPEGMVMVPRELTEEDVRNISKEFIKDTPSGMRLDAVIRRVHSTLTAFQPCHECGSPQRCYRLGACRLSNLLSAAEAEGRKG